VKMQLCSPENVLLEKFTACILYLTIECFVYLFSWWLNYMHLNFIKKSWKRKCLDFNKVVDIYNDHDESDKHLQHSHSGVELEVM
jgi:hypothetical protein